MPTRSFDADVIYTSSGTVSDRGGQALATDSTGATTAGMVDYGVSLLTNTSSDIFTLTPPKPGLRRTLICTSSSSVTQVVVRGSTAQTVSFDKVGNTLMKVKPAASTHDVVINLIGVTATRWAIASIFPILTTGLSAGVITLSTV